MQKHLIGRCRGSPEGHDFIFAIPTSEQHAKKYGNGKPMVKLAIDVLMGAVIVRTGPTNSMANRNL